jgi:hypothetical protein
MPAPLDPQLDPTLSGIDALPAAGQPRPQPNPKAGPSLRPANPIAGLQALAIGLPTGCEPL